MKILLSVLAILLLGACSQETSLSSEPFTAVALASPAEPPAGTTGGDKPRSEIFAYHPETFVSAPSHARIFLIAGDRQRANFAQEILDQKALWLRAGYSESDIACYYVIPPQRYFELDETQYRALAPQLRRCYPASPKLIWEHLGAAAANARDFLYVYATSYGGEPPSLRIIQSGMGFPGKLALGKILTRFPDLDQFVLSMDALPDGKTGELGDHLRQIAEKDSDPSNHLFTPRYLKKALQHWPAAVSKTVVIAGCYSGGFIKSDKPKWKDDGLSSLDTITVLTSAAANRQSFGCGSGEERTVFGEIYNHILSKQSLRLGELSWRKVYDAVDGFVTGLEKKLGMPASEPQFFSNE